MVASIEWGTAGEWAQAAGSILVIAVTLTLWMHERSERRRDEARRHSHAVNTWLDITDRWVVVIVNGGPDPVTDWSVSICSDRPCTHAAGKHRWETVVSNRDRGPLPPGREITVPLDARLHPDKGETVGLQVTFIDSAQRRWWREGSEVRRV